MKAHYSHFLVRATEYAALAASRSQGLGDWKRVVRESRNALLKSLQGNDGFNLRILNDRFYNHPEIEAFPQVIGDINAENTVDLIFSAVDGQKATAMGGNNTASFAMIGSRGTFLQIPRVYVNKIIVPQPAYRLVDINLPLVVNIKRVARALKKYIQNTVVCVLDRPTNKELIDEIRYCGAKLKLIQDGEVSTALAITHNMNADMLVGLGGAQECVMISGFMKSVGGYLQAKFIPNELTKTNPLIQHDKIYEAHDFVGNENVIGSGSGITGGEFLKGVSYERFGAKTYSFSVRGSSKTLREIRTTHYFDYKVFY